MNRRITVLQTGALPLGYVTILISYAKIFILLKNNILSIEDVVLERITGLEPATSTLARLRSTK